MKYKRKVFYHLTNLLGTKAHTFDDRKKVLIGSVPGNMKLKVHRYKV